MNWLTDFNESKDQSAKTRKPILLQFEMENCGGCKKLYAETYRDQQVQDEMQQWFVLLKLDLIKDREMRRDLAAYWTPSFYVLDHKDKSYYHFNGYLPPVDFRIILRLGLAEAWIPRGRYDETVNALSQDVDSLSDSALYPALLKQRALAGYIKTKDRDIFRGTMRELRETYPDSLEARMYFWQD